jgi:hypothetical protein
MNQKLVAITVIAVAIFASTPPATAAEVAGAFGKDSTQLAITAGSGHAFDESYLVLGLGVNRWTQRRPVFRIVVRGGSQHV